MNQFLSFTFALLAASWPQLQAADAPSSQQALVALKAYLAKSPDDRPALKDQPFATAALTQADAVSAAAMLQANHRQQIRTERAAEMKARTLTHQGKAMPFFYKVFGAKPENGRRLYISMHGGGGAPKRVNDSQWENQKRLYAPKEGVYVAPRAPTDTWNLWHQSHIDPLFERLIENLIVFEDVDPNRVYLMGYSAGGDGVYQLAPRMADHFAAASMMAGHPNETSPLGLRNLPFSIHVGSNDNGYKRNQIARQWQTKLADLKKADPIGYTHWAKLYAGKGHWMNREDAAAVPWMAKFARKRYPDKIVWKQDDVTHKRFYWLAVDSPTARSLVEVERNGQTFNIIKAETASLKILLNDDMVDLEKPVTVKHNGKTVFNGKVPRTLSNLHRTLSERGDPTMLFSGALEVKIN